MSLSELIRDAQRAPVKIPRPTQTEGFSVSDLKAAAAAVDCWLSFRVVADDTDVGLEMRAYSGHAALNLAAAFVVRDDAAGFERALLSVLPHVDEIVVAVDGRSRPETAEVARQYADTVVTFQAADIGMPDQDWADDKIHFANARNFGRERVKAPWTLVIDSDEVLVVEDDAALNLRSLAASLRDDVGAVHMAMGNSEFSQRDAQRLARTEFRFFSPMHNQLPIEGDVVECPAGVYIAHDVSLRPAHEQERRVQQREVGIEELVKEGKKGNIGALFHAAKHYLGHNDADTGIPLAEQYRLRTQIHGLHSAERAWLALSCAALYQHREKFLEAEVWAIRALMEGPRIDALGMLGDLAEQMGDLNRARQWYEAACAIEGEAVKFGLEGEAERRFARRDGLRIALMRGRDDHALTRIKGSEL